MKLKPVNDRIVIKKKQAKTETETGLVIPEAAQEKPQIGEVIATSEECCVRIPLSCFVLFGKYSGTDVTFDGEDYTIMKAEDVLAVIEKGEEQ